MKCPKCESTMEQVTYEGTQVDRCTGCKGLWFDRSEREALARPEAAAAIDIGDPATGERMNAVDRYLCPRCSGGMVRMVDPKQSHIWYEQCVSCGGSFFDAGELKDLSERTISDFFKSLSTPPRD